MTKAVKILRYIKTGSSLPIVFECNDNSILFVKGYGSGHGIFPKVAEYIISSIAKYFQVPTLIPKLVLLDQNIDFHNHDPEVTELIERSYGTNLAFDFKDNINTQIDINKYPKELRDRIFLFDLFFLNIDRTFKNINCFEDQGNLYVTDFEMSMLFQGIIQSYNFANSKQVLSQIKVNPFYTEEIGTKNFIMSLSSFQISDLLAILENIPKEWKQIDKFDEQIINAFQQRIEEFAKIDEIIANIQQIQLESLEEKNLRLQNNLEQFEKNISVC